ncbi:hypothetical protein LCGC14_0615840 [marine sediment metagenome]|uniref:Phage head-tail adaptor n=1 Tax=marine sediment metagenome TaxID=412755 RepID=A0A0F9R695_9ZZZZ
MSRNRINSPRRKVSIGDLKTIVSLRYRELAEPSFGDVDIDEAFSDHIDVWAKVVSRSGTEMFGGVTSDIPITHTVYIRYESAVNTTMWVELGDGTLLDILDTEDLDEENEFLKLVCSKRGSRENVAARI